MSTNISIQKLTEIIESNTTLKLVTCTQKYQMYIDGGRSQLPLLKYSTLNIPCVF